MEPCCVVFHMQVFSPTGSPQQVESMAPPPVNYSQNEELSYVLFARAQQARLFGYCIDAERQAWKICIPEKSTLQLIKGWLQKKAAWFDSFRLTLLGSNANIPKNVNVAGSIFFF